MAVLEPDRHAFEAKGQLGGQDHLVDMDATSQQPPLSNDHTFQNSLQSHASINDSAHQSNLEIDTQDFAPKTNGVTHTQESNLEDPQTSFATSSNLPSSAETAGTCLPSSSQSVPDDMAMDSAKLEESPINTSPAVVQQPTSDVRKETQPASADRTAEIKEQKEQQDIRSDSALVNETVPGTVDLTTTTAPNQEPATASHSPPHQTQTSLADPPMLAEEQNPVASNIVDPSMSQQSDLIPTAEVANHPPVPIPDGAAPEAPLDPAPSPTLPAGAAPAPELREATPDHTMPDAPSPPPKMAREREDDVEEGPAAKRSKIDNDPSPDFKVPERPVINTQMNGEPIEQTSKGSNPMTIPQHKALLRAIQNVKRIQASSAFRQPVDVVGLKIPAYYNYVTKPMDLRTLEENLKAWKYPTVDACVADFNQIVENSRLFNGLEHGVTKAAYEMKASFEKQLEKVPGPEIIEPTPTEKKKKATLPPAPKVSAPRRESRSSLPGAGRSPVSTASTPTFALTPQGMPLIRRDSTLGDGRPKREIHPPAPKDLPYTNQKPKKKKYMYELKFCERFLNEIAKDKYAGVTWPFMVPVDPVALNIPTYHSIIKKPMDFGTMKSKLEHGEYENAKEFEADAKQVFQNCYKFNRQGDEIYRAGQELESIFDSEWTKKRGWIEANTPASGAQSPGSSEAEDSDGEEEEEEEEDEAAIQLSKLQQQIAQMSKQVEMIKEKKKSPPVSSKKAAKGSKAPRKDTKKAAAPAKAEKKAASKPTKKPPYVTYEQKQDISNRINALSETKMASALNIIRSSMPNLKGVQDDELELDIDELSDEVLHKLLVFVRKHVPQADDSPVRPLPATSTVPPTRKKNKPMSKHEQEARIAQVQSGLSAFQNPGSAPVYDDPGPDQESSDGGESSESEEE